MPAAPPRVTIVVPSFQQGRYLGASLRSLVDQMPERLEILVYDCASTDETPEVLAGFRHIAARVIVEKDRGQSAALNRGFREARGDVIGWLNADDMLMPGAIGRAVRILDETDADVVYGQCAHLDGSGRFIDYFHFTRDFDSHELRNYNDFIPQPATFFRRSLLDRVGPLDESLHYAMDWDLWCRFARREARFRFVPEVWAGARTHAAAKTSRGGVRRLMEVWRVNSRHRTLPLPMLPILYAGYRINRALRIGRIPALQSWWRLLTGGDRSTLVHGVAHGGYLVEDPARITYPCHQSLAGITLDLDDADHAPASVIVNGRMMRRENRLYAATLPDGPTAAIDIRISGLGRGLPAPFEVGHLPTANRG